MLNMDFNLKVVIDTNRQDWVASPMPGVWRKPLAREDAERGHATSIVRYEPGAAFSAHDHPKGEEILVLEGVFSDATSDYPAGTYFRNPKGFRHAPFSREGCVLLVKLHQFQPQDSGHVCINTRTATWSAGPGKLQVMPLHEFNSEQVELMRWPAGEQLQPGDSAQVQAAGSGFGAGEEIYVISGELTERGESGDRVERYPAGTWIRSSRRIRQNLRAAHETIAWVKTGHLQLNDKGEQNQ